MAERNIPIRAWCERFNTLGEVSRIETMTNPHGETGPCCKVGAVAEAFELEGLNATLRERWIADEDRSGVRELADHVNVRLLESALRTDPEGALEGEAENYYRLLTDDDVSRGMRTEARNRLRDRGIDVGGIEERFVSHQTIRDTLGPSDHYGISRPRAIGPDRIEIRHRGHGPTLMRRVSLGDVPPHIQPGRGGQDRSVG